MQCVLALDQGTSSSRAILFGHDGNVISLAQWEFRQIYPQPGWVEHDPEKVWATQLQVAAEAISRAPGAEVRAIGITNQRETSLLWNRATGQAVANAIVWQDRRTAAMCDQLRHAEPLIRKKTGLQLDPYFSATKIAWLLDHIEGARQQAERGELAFGTMDSWLVWKLTAGRAHVTDASNASRTMLFDIHRGEWDDELLELFHIPRSLLPQICASSSVAGQTAEGLPIPAGIPIAGIAGDQQAALFGQRCIRPGMAKNTYGTGCFVVMNTGSEAVVSESGLLTTIAWSLASGPTQYAMEGSVFIAGAAVQWLRDCLGIIKSAGEVELLAGSVADSGGVTFVPAFTGLGAPWWDPHARGTILGISRGTSAAHIARAALEAIALQTADILEAMRRDTGIAIEEMRVDGGGSTNDLLMQIQADLAGVPVVRAGVSESTALGAAYLAGLAIGFWQSQAELDAHWKAGRRFEPVLDAGSRRAVVERWRRGVERSRGWEDRSG